jgi:hypothetical protein
MKRQIPGLHLNQRGVENRLEGLFLVRVDKGGPKGRRRVRLCTLGAQSQLDAPGGIQAGG